MTRKDGRENQELLLATWSFKAMMILAFLWYSLKKMFFFPDNHLCPSRLVFLTLSVHYYKIPVAFSTATVRHSLEIDDIFMARSTFSYLVFTVVPTAIFPPWGNGLCLGKWYHWSYFESHFLKLKLSVIWEWMLLHWYIMPYGQSICILTGAFWMPGSIEETCNPDITRNEVVKEHFSPQTISSLVVFVQVSFLKGAPASVPQI